MKDRSIFLNRVVGCFVFTLAMTTFFGPGAWAQKILIDEVMQSLLLQEAQVQSMQVDVVKNPGSPEEMRGVLKWENGGRVQLVFTTDGNGDPLPNPVKGVLNEVDVLDVDVNGQRTYSMNSFDYMTCDDVITILRGVAVDPQLIWVFSNDKTIIDEAPDDQYSVKAIGASMELRMDIDLANKVITSMETYVFGSLQSTYQASGFVPVGSLYLPSSVTADPDVNDANPPVTFAYSNYVLNPSPPGRTFLMPQ